jgi:hypothetical protein
MLPAPSFNPNFANLAALHGIRGIPHPVGPTPMPNPVAPGRFALPPGGGFSNGGPMPFQPIPQMPVQGAMPMQPQGNIGNLQVLMRMFGQR